MRLVSFVLVGMGCMSPRASPPVTPAPPVPVAFGCHGDPDEPKLVDPTIPRVELRKLRLESDGVHFEALAESATAAQFGARLGQVLGAPVVVDEGLVGYRFSLFLPDVTLEKLNATMNAQWGVTVTKRDGLISMSPPGGGTQFAPDIQPILVRVIKPTGRQTAEQLARVFCLRHATARGSAYVIGDTVIVEDIEHRMAHFVALLEMLAR